MVAVAMLAQVGEKTRMKTSRKGPDAVPRWQTGSASRLSEDGNEVSNKTDYQHK
jgi:hypothetical protein